MTDRSQMETRRERSENHERSGEQSPPVAWGTERHNKENHTNEAVAYSTDNLQAETLTGKSTEESHPDREGSGIKEEHNADESMRGRRERKQWKETAAEWRGDKQLLRSRSTLCNHVCC